FAVRAGGQYLFRNLLLRISPVVIDPDGWFLIHLLAALVRDTRKAPTESIVTKFFEKLPLQFKGGVLVDRRPSNAQPIIFSGEFYSMRLGVSKSLLFSLISVLGFQKIRRLDSKTQYVVLIGRFDTSYPTGGYGVSGD
ncbi:hypothetical protein Tco_1560043, partial [Tanacetum coccineum]